MARKAVVNKVRSKAKGGTGIRKGNSSAVVAGVNSHVLTKQLEKVKNEDGMDSLGFIYIGTAIEVLGIKDEDPEVCVWRKSNGTLVTMYDEGNGKCSFIAIIKHSSSESYANAKPTGELVLV